MYNDTFIDNYISEWLQDPLNYALWHGLIDWADIPGALSTIPSFPISDDPVNNTDTDDDSIDETSWSTVKRSSSVTSDNTHKTNSSDYDSNINRVKTIIIHNLPRINLSLIHNALKKLFKAYGSIHDIYIPKNNDKSCPLYGTIKGFAIIKYQSHIHATKAYNSLAPVFFLLNNHSSIQYASNDK